VLLCLEFVVASIFCYFLTLATSFCNLYILPASVTNLLYISHRKSSKIQQCVKISFHIYMKLNMFRPHTTHHQEPKTALAASGLHTWRVVGRVVAGRCQSPATTRPTACWPLIPKFAGSHPAEVVGFYRAKKSSARLPSEEK